MAFPEVDRDLVEYLDEKLPELVTAENLFVGPLRPVSDIVPVDAVFVLSTGGAPPDRTFRPGRVEIQYPAVQIRVRSVRKQDGMKLLFKIYDALQSVRFDRYKDVRTETSDPTWIEISDDEYYHWSWDFELFTMEFMFQRETVKISSHILPMVSNGSE